MWVQTATPDYSEQLKFLASPPDTWAVDNGKPPTEAALKSLEVLLRSGVTVTALADGGLEVCWANATLEFGPDGLRDNF